MPRILLIHAEAAKAKLAEHSLRNGVDGDVAIESAESRADGLRRLRMQTLPRITAIILSLDLPDCPGIAAFQSVREAAPQFPILVIAGVAREECAKLAVTSGADDYILEEDLGNYRLPKAVRNMLERASHSEALFSATERAEVTLNSIGDAVVSTDVLGNSSLSYLRRFPLDALKIDKSFVQGLCTNAEDAKIVSAVINLGRSFHLLVIAEGVETRAQFLALQGQNCGEGQGYYFRKPIAAHEFTKLLGPDLSTTDIAG
jgi:CheY-like chemotaxis protein